MDSAENAAKNLTAHFGQFFASHGGPFDKGPITTAFEPVFETSL